SIVRPACWQDRTGAFSTIARSAGNIQTQNSNPKGYADRSACFTIEGIGHKTKAAGSRSSCADDALAVPRHAARGVARVHHQRGMSDDPVPIISRVIGGDQHAVLPSKERFVQQLTVEVEIVPAVGQLRDVRIVVTDLGPLL